MANLSRGQNIFDEKQWDMILNSMPSEPITNYMYKNNGDLTFSKVMKDWALGHKSWSNGVAYGDLDNDGDLDLIVNNIDQEAFVYENIQKDKQYIRISFNGPPNNINALGTKVTIFHGDQSQFQQHYLARGYRSSMEPIMHFGIGSDTLIQKMKITWPDGKMSVYKNVASNQVMQINYTDALEKTTVDLTDTQFLFEDVTEDFNMSIRHAENELEDFMREPMLPYQLSTLGPAFAIGDVNGDGMDDLYLGGAFRRQGQLLVQDEKFGFSLSQEKLWKSERMYEDVGAAFFDVENDGDLDLFVVSGGNENTLDNNGLLDRLYLNDGLGKFTKTEELLDTVNCSGSVIIPADYDHDGDLDVFVGGRMVPAQYPLPASSYLLNNINGKLVDVTKEKAPELIDLGLVTDALWSDYDVDGDLDLVIVGEWMPITIFVNESGKFKKIDNSNNGLVYSSGWWGSIVSDDFDKDGDPDYVVGNIGFNYKFEATKESPLELFYDDFDDKNAIDIAIGYTQNGELYSVNSRAKILRQNPDLNNRINSNDAFSESTLIEIYGKEKLDSANHHKIYTLATSYLENKGQGRFDIRPFDNRTQISNTNSIIIYDIDQDRNNDLILAGNLHGMEAETIRIDGGVGTFLKGEGNGEFRTIANANVGLFMPGDVRHLGIMKTSADPVLMCIKNDDYIQVIKLPRLRY